MSFSGLGLEVKDGQKYGSEIQFSANVFRSDRKPQAIFKRSPRVKTCPLTTKEKLEIRKRRRTSLVSDDIQIRK